MKCEGKKERRGQIKEMIGQEVKGSKNCGEKERKGINFEWNSYISVSFCTDFLLCITITTVFYFIS